MAEQVIREWLAEYKSLSLVEIHSFASSILHNHELIQAIYNILDDRSRQHELLEPVCNQLFSFYRSHEEELKRFVLQFIPTLIAVYVSSLGQPEKRNYRSIEVLLLGIYNLEVVDPNGKPKIQAFQLPSLAQPSIYHEPMSGASVTLTENALSRLEKGDIQHINIGPFPQVETLNAQSRLRVMTILMSIYNNHLSYITKPSLHALCKSCSKLVKQGFNRQGHFQRSSYGNETGFANVSYPRTGHRVTLSAPLLLEYLHAVYYAIYNGFSQIATQTLEDIHSRAIYELYPDVLMTTNAVRSTLKLNPAGQPIDGPMGISVALSPTTSTSTVSKSIVTNASFRTKKLPDDIPIQEQTTEKSLTTISEEFEDSTEKNRIPKEKSKEKVSMVQLISKKVEKVKSSSRKEDITSPASVAPASTKEAKTKDKEKVTEPKKKNTDAENVVLLKSVRREGEPVVPTGMSTANINKGSITGEPVVFSKNAAATTASASKTTTPVVTSTNKGIALTTTAAGKGAVPAATSAGKGTVPVETVASKGTAPLGTITSKGVTATATSRVGGSTTSNTTTTLKDTAAATVAKGVATAAQSYAKSTTVSAHVKGIQTVNNAGPSAHSKSVKDSTTPRGTKPCTTIPVVQNGEASNINRCDPLEGLYTQARNLYDRMPCNVFHMEVTHMPAGGNKEPRSPLLSETDSHFTDNIDDVSVESSSEMDEFSSSSTNPKREMDGNVLQGVVHTIV